MKNSGCMVIVFALIHMFINADVGFSGKATQYAQQKEKWFYNSTKTPLEARERSINADKLIPQQSEELWYPYDLFVLNQNTLVPFKTVARSAQAHFMIGDQEFALKNYITAEIASAPFVIMIDDAGNDGVKLKAVSKKDFDAQMKAQTEQLPAAPGGPKAAFKQNQQSVVVAQR